MFGRYEATSRFDFITNGRLKAPSILYFERIDMRDKLDYSELPVMMDLSILQSDVQHFLFVDGYFSNMNVLSPNFRI